MLEMLKSDYRIAPWCLLSENMGKLEFSGIYFKPGKKSRNVIEIQKIFF